MTKKTDNPPYPRFGECFRTLALAFDTKAGNREVDRLAREGDYDWSLLPQLTDELLLTPLSKYVDPEFASLLRLWLDHMHIRYRELILGATVDSLGRADALPILISNFFAPQAIWLLVAARKDLGGPELTRLLDSEKNPVAVVMDWLNEGEEIPLGKVAFPGTTDHDRAGYEKVRKWIRGSDVPTLGSIKMFADAIDRRGSICKEKTISLRRWLVLARALSYLEKQLPSFPVRQEMLRYLLSGMPNIDVQSILWRAVQSCAGRYSPLSLPALTLYENLKRTTPKESGAQEQAKHAIEELERLTAEHDPEGNTAFHLEWIKGRWHALSGQLDDALCHYDNAVTLGSYRAGSQLTSILEEALALAAFLANKPYLKRFKNQAVATGLFADPKGKAVIENWEIDQASQQFHRIFPHRGRFPEASPVEEGKGQFGLLVLDQEEMNRLRPDLGTPDRVRTLRFLGGEVRRRPQLMIFSSLGKAPEVAALLNKGAPVDQLDDVGGSALLCAIQHAVDTGDRRTLDLLLEIPHAKATIDSVTAKKQITPLLCAIDYGEPDVVEKLLQMGATADLRGNIIDETPLYHVMETLGSIRFPGKLYRFLYNSLSANRDLVQQEVMRRYGISMAGVFGDSRRLRALREDARYEEILQKLITALVKERIVRHSVSKLLRMTELLLQYGANPNARHDYPAPGRTPLMLAAENDSAPAFDMMLQGVGDPYQTDSEGRSSITIALGFGAAEVVRSLRTKKII
jgi:hypothetical protein